MSLISDAFKECRQKKRKALIPYLTSGFPQAGAFRRLLEEFVRAGADMIEIGVPFSDPMADGKTIQYSSQMALENGVNIEKTFDYVSQMRERNETPLILMSYYNPVHHYGLSRFVKTACQAGVAGLIIPDLIPEEGGALEQACRRSQIDLVYLVAPTSGPRRRKLIVKRSSGFVYLVSVAGVTGARQSLPRELTGWIKQVKKETSLPVCVGFGISNAAQARAVTRAADGVIIGSAIIDVIKRAADSRSTVKQVGEFVKQIRKGLNHE